MNVVIVGLAPRSFEIEASDEVWAINDARVTRCDRRFQLHGRRHIMERHGALGLAHLREVAKGETRVYMGQGRVVGARAFPFKKITDEFGRYFNNSFSWVIAFAVLEGAHRITLDGVMFSEQEPRENWMVPCVEYALGIAVGHGCKVSVPPGCGLLGSYYGSQLYCVEGPGSV